MQKSWQALGESNEPQTIPASHARAGDRVADGLRAVRGVAQGHDLDGVTLARLCDRQLGAVALAAIKAVAQHRVQNAHRISS